MERGEVQWADWWPFAGSEPAGDHYVLLLNWDGLSPGGYRIVLPLTSQAPPVTYYWEPYVAATESWVLIPSIKATRVRLSQPKEEVASPEDLNNIGFQLSRLISAEESNYHPDCNRGDIWQVNLAEPGQDPHRVKVLVLRYDHRNKMAMTLQMVARQDGPAQLEVPVYSCSTLQNYSVMVGRPLPLSHPHRFESRIDCLCEPETNRVAEAFVNLVAPGQG